MRTQTDIRWSTKKATKYDAYSSISLKGDACSAAVGVFANPHLARIVIADEESFFFLISHCGVRHNALIARSWLSSDCVMSVKAPSRCFHTFASVALRWSFLFLSSFRTASEYSSTPTPPQCLFLYSVRTS